MNALTSRERMLKAMSYEEVDHIPCCFMSFTALRKRCHENMYELAKAELDMGFDSMLFIPYASREQRPEHPDLRGLPVRFPPEVKIRKSREVGPDQEQYLQKEYQTPEGNLITRVRISEDWPHGDNIPLLDDYQIPRTVKPLVQEIEDLRALKYLLQPPQKDDRSTYLNEARHAQAFAEEHQIILAGGWGVGLDMAGWLCSIQDLTLLTIDKPEFISLLLEMIHNWNMQRMEVLLSAPLDLFIRRAWYEGCEFVTPKFYQKEILPRLKAEVDLAHSRGAKFGLIRTSGTKPFLDFYIDAGIDVLMGVDPIQGTYTDIPLMKKKFDGKVCLWGGVSGAVTIEMGTESDVRLETQRAIQTMGPTGLILSPVDNITVDQDVTWKNLEIFRDEWLQQAGTH